MVGGCLEKGEAVAVGRSFSDLCKKNLSILTSIEDLVSKLAVISIVR